MRRDDARAESALREHDERRRAEHGHRGRAGRGDRELGRHGGVGLAPRVAPPLLRLAFDLGDDPAHRLDGEPRILPGRRLGRQHHRVGAVEDRVRDVARLGARRARMRDHRLEHLRRRDHRTAEPVAERDDPLLRVRHFLERQLHAEVAARDHHARRTRAMMLSMFSSAESFSILATTSIDLRNHRPQLGDVLGAAHEAQREVFEVLLHGERDVLAVLVRDRRRRHLHAGQIDSLVAGERAAVQHARRDAASVDVEHDELDQPVVDENAVADVDVVATDSRR